MSNAFLFRLPQTVVRAFGLPHVHSLSPIQVRIPRPWQRESKESFELARLNGILIRALTGQKYIPSLDQDRSTKLLSSGVPVVDYNLLYHGKTDYLNDLGGFDVIDYATSNLAVGHGEVFHSPIAYLRASKRKLFLHNRLQIKTFFTWVGQTQIKSNFFTQYPWKTEVIDFNVWRERVLSTTDLVVRDAPLLHKYIDESCPLIISVTNFASSIELKANLINLLESNEELRNLFERLDTSVYLKPHRSIWLSSKAMNSFTLLGKKVRPLSSAIERHMPLEWYMTVNANSKLICELTGTVFSIESPRLFRINSGLEKRDLESHKLMIRRRLKYDANFPWN